MLEFPLHESFFPQVVLNAEEVRYYKRLGKERLNELIRIAEDAELAYKWTDIRTPKMNTTIQKTQFLDMRPATKATFASTLIKCSVVIPDTRADEVLLAIARSKTKDYRKMMSHLHGSAFMDGRTLFKFPSSIASSRPDYSYRAIKWCAFKGKGESSKLDFSFLEYAGKRKPSPGSSVVGFCLQESIQREREIPLLEDFGFVRGYLSRSGIIVSKTHQSSVVKVTAICQIDGDIETIVRSVLEGIMQDMVGSIVRMRVLLDRQRVSGMKFLEQWEWIANGDRKACAVCLKGFFFHRKHHCRACGEVVCSSCAPLRALDEPIYEIRELRICTSCMTNAGRMLAPEASNDRNNNNLLETMTSEDSSQSYTAGDARGPKKNSLEERQFIENESKDRMRRPSDAAQLLLSNKGTPKSKRRIATFLKDPREKVSTLSHLVDQIRDARGTINITLSDTGDHRTYGEEDAYTDLYQEMSTLREAVESSFIEGSNNRTRRPSVQVSSATGGPGGLRRQTPSPAPSGRTRPGHDDHAYEDQDSYPSLEFQLPEENVQRYNSVLVKAIAAGNATRAAGRAVLSSCASDYDARDDLHDARHHHDNNLPSSPSDTSGYSSSETSKDPYASVNYERAMKDMGPSNRDPHDDVFASLSGTFASQQQRTRRPSRVHLLEKKIEDLQRDLMDAQRKLSYFEPEPEYDGLDVVHEEPYDVEGGVMFRSNPRPVRRPSDFMRGPPEPPQSYPRALRQAQSKNRPKSDSLPRAEPPSRRSMDIGAFDRQRGPQQQRRGSEYLPRPSAPALTSRASMGNRAHSTAEKVHELFSVMNPSEMSKSAGPPRKSSLMKSSPPAPRARSASPSHSQRPRLSGSRPPPPPPPASASAVSLYIDEKGRVLPGTPDSSVDSPRKSHGLDKTASSSASYAPAFDESHSSNGSGRLGSSGGPRPPRQSVAAYYDNRSSSPDHDELDDHEEMSSSDDSDVFGALRSNQHEDDSDDDAREDARLRRESAFFGDAETNDVAFFGQQVVPTATRALQGQPRRSSLLGAPPRPSMLARGMDAQGGRDESEELRDLMEGLGRPRSNSVPFRTPGAEEPAVRPTSDGASVRRVSTPLSRDPSPADRYERMPWSDDKYARRPPSSSTRSRAESTSIKIGNPDRYTNPAESIATRPVPRQMSAVVSEIRSCLSSLHTQCPSQWERHRKLVSISKIMQSLLHDGSRSDFLTLSHEDFQYERVLEETPSIVQLLRLAGYVSQPQKLVIRNVNSESIAVLLHEIESELHEMQATQDYL